MKFDHMDQLKQYLAKAFCYDGDDDNRRDGQA